MKGTLTVLHLGSAERLPCIRHDLPGEGSTIWTANPDLSSTGWCTLMGWPANEELANALTAKMAAALTETKETP